MARINAVAPGLAVLALGLIGLFWVIPEQIVTPAGTSRGMVAPDFWPRIVVVLITLLGALLLASEVAALFRRRPDGVDRAAAGTSGMGLLQALLRTLAALAILFGYQQLLEPVGMPLASALAFAAFAIVAGERRPLVITLMAAVIPTLLHLFFTRVAHVPMPMGLLQ